MAKAGKIESFCNALGIPVYRYEQKRDDGSGLSDLVIIPCYAKQMTSVEWDNFIQYANEKLQAQGLTVLTHREYRQCHLTSTKEDHLAMSNRFAELQMPVTELDDAATDKSSVQGDADKVARDCGFAMVDKRSRKQREQLKKRESKGRTRCLYGRYCDNLPGCDRGHTVEERRVAKVSGTKRPSRIKMCNRETCVHKACMYAHSASELRYPTCDGVGGGHRLGQCPELQRTVV